MQLSITFTDNLNAITIFTFILLLRHKTGYILGTLFRYSQNFPRGKIGLKQVIDTITHPMLNTSTQPLKVVQKTELKFKLMCKIRAPRLYWADIATSENINTRNEFTHF